MFKTRIRRMQLRIRRMRRTWRIWRIRWTSLFLKRRLLLLLLLVAFSRLTER